MFCFVFARSTYGNVDGATLVKVAHALVCCKCAVAQYKAGDRDQVENIDYFVEVDIASNARADFRGGRRGQRRRR